MAASCGGSSKDTRGFGGAGGVGGATNTGGAPQEGGAGTSGTGGSGAAVNTDGGTACAGGCDGGQCINGVCCPEDQVCDTSCCGTGDVCSFLKCETPGADCIDSTDCAPTEFCDQSLGEEVPAMDSGTCQGGAVLTTGKCLPKPPTCAPGVVPGPNDPLTCLPDCEFRPPSGAFTPVLKAHWDKASIMMSPIVIQLDDDNCDGAVNERDIPEILFISFPNTSDGSGDSVYNAGHATLWAISLVNGAFVEKWSYSSTVNPLRGSVEIAAGNFDGLPGNEIVVCTYNGKVQAIDASGNPLWLNEEAGCRLPSIGDVEGDGQVEILTNTRLLRGTDGVTLATFPSTPKALADVTGDGVLDVVGPGRVWDAAGTELANASLPGFDLAIADFDLDGVPEITSVDKPNHQLNVWRYDTSQPGNFRVVRSGVDINGTFPNNCPAGSSGSTTGGGPPTIADFNGDGTPDVAVAGGIGYAVVDGTKILDMSVPADQTLLWLMQTRDCSSAATGSSIFDFNGDGSAEVVYSDENFFRIYNGLDGTELFKTCNTTGTLIEYPLVADVDADGHADVVVVANDYSSITCPDDGSKQTGLRVFGDTEGKWVRTRRIWNQHNYHVTNVNEDGTIPAPELRNWTQPRLNNYRQNVQPAGEFSAPDLIVTASIRCAAGTELVAMVRNIGAASVPPGVVVGFYDGDPAAGGTRLGEATTTRELAPAESEQVSIFVTSLPQNQLYAVVDDGGPPHAWQECRPDNNTSDSTAPVCPGPR